MGIGAYQVRKFVEQAGGQVHAEREHGRGTVFRLCFPSLDFAPAAAGTSEIDQSNMRELSEMGSPEAPDKRLFVVEDDARLRKQLKRCFDEYAVVTVENREAALAAVRCYEPPVLLQTSVSRPMPKA